MWFVSSSKLQSGFILELLLVWLLVCFFVVVVGGGGVFFWGLVFARNYPRGPFLVFVSWKFFLAVGGIVGLACAGEQDPAPSAGETQSGNTSQDLPALWEVLLPPGTGSTHFSP